MKNADSGILRLHRLTGRVRLIASEQALRRAAADGFYAFSRHGLPKLYHGLVVREVFESHRRQVGRHLGGLSPDVYGAVIAALSIGRVAEVDTPFSIAGVCGESMSAAGARGQHRGTWAEAPHLQFLPDYIPAKEIPKMYSVETIWADGALSALKASDAQEIIKKFSINSVYAFTIANNRTYWLPIVRERLHSVTWGQRPGALLGLAWAIARGPGMTFVRRSWKRVRIIARLEEFIVADNVINIHSAADICMKKIKVNPYV